MSNETIGLIGAGATVAGVVATLFSPQFQRWWEGRESRKSLVTLGDIDPPVSPSQPLPVGVVKADRLTLEAIQEALPSGNIDWLHQKDFGNAFPWNMLEKVEHFTWNFGGPEHEFLDSELEQMRCELKDAAERLVNVAIRHTSYITHGSEIRKIEDQYDEQGRYSEGRFFAKAKEINDAAEQVYVKYIALIRRARLKLALAEPGEEQ